MGRRRHEGRLSFAKGLDPKKGIPTSGKGFRGIFNMTSQITQGLLEGDRLKIAKQQTPQQKKKPLSSEKTMVSSKKKATGKSPTSAIAGNLGSASGGSVRL